MDGYPSGEGRRSSGRPSLWADCYQSARAAYPELIRRRAASRWLLVQPGWFLFGLAPGGGCLAAALLRTPVVSYTTISPLPSPQSAPIGRERGSGGIFLWPDPAPYGTPGVTRRLALRSADFPRSQRDRDLLTNLGSCIIPGLKPSVNQG